MSFWGWIFMFVIVWGVWSALPSDPCVRVHRAAAPIRGAGELVQMAVRNWADAQTNVDLIQEMGTFGNAAEQFIAQEFYGKGLVCRWGNSEDSIGFNPTNPIGNNAGVIPQNIPGITPHGH